MTTETMAHANSSKPLWMAPANARVSAHMVVYDKKLEECPEFENNVNEYWDERTRANPRLFDGPIWAMTHWSFAEVDGCLAKLSLHAHLTSYKYVLYRYFSGRCTEFSGAGMAKALGASAITVTSDGFVVLGLRSGLVGTTPHTWHFVPAGNVDRENLDALMASELQEELGIAQWAGIRVFGLFDTGKDQGNKTEIVFVIELHETMDQVTRKFQTLEDHEHQEIRGFKNAVPDDLRLTEVSTAALRCFFAQI